LDINLKSATCPWIRRPPAAVASSATDLTRSGSRPTSATSAPRRASSIAAARPMPRVAPVSTTTVTQLNLPRTQTQARAPKRLAAAMILTEVPDRPHNICWTHPVVARQALILLGSILQPAFEAGHLQSNPTRAVRKAPLPRRAEVRPLAPITVERMRSASSPRDAALLSVLGSAGLLPVEALGLQWRDIRENTILLDLAVSLGKEEDTKTLAPTALKALAWAPARFTQLTPFARVGRWCGSRVCECSFWRWLWGAERAWVAVGGLAPGG